MRCRILAVVLVSGCVAQEPSELGEQGSAVQVCGGSIQAAIDAAPQDAVLEICAGTYHERLVVDGKRLELRGVSGAAATIIDGDGGRTLMVRNVAGTGVLVRGLTLHDGAASSSGGGVACRTATLRMRDSVVQQSRGAGGGGLGAEGCVLDIARTSFRGNDAGSGRGGGALIVGGSGVIADSVFDTNNAEEGGGVAVVGGTVELANNVVDGNSAHRGGGLFVGHDGLVRGNTISDNEGRWTGGGIYVDARTGRFEGNTIDGNTSVNDGGGVYVHQGAPVFADNVIASNYSADDGGGLRLFESAARAERNVIELNEAADSGGGVRVSHVQATLVDNIVRNNTATQGGGMDLDNDASIVRGGMISGNRAGNGAGIAAGLYPWDGGVIEDVQLLDNVATGSGGALYVFDNFVPMAMRGLVVRGNRAARGGGLYVRGTHHRLANSVFARNTASAEGGAIHVASSSTTATHDFLTLYANTAGSGQAVWFAAPVTFRNSIISGHSGTAVRVSAAPSWRYNDVWPASFGGMSNPTGSSGNISADPRFADATINDFRLGSGSLAIDAADPSLTDVNGTRADMGVFGGPGGSDAPPPPPPPPPADGVVLEADAQVLADQPGTNFGSTSSLAADQAPLGESYLRFRVTGSSNVTGAKLQLTVTNATADAPTVHSAASTWAESSITWNDRPALGAAVANLGAVSTGVIEYDVSAVVGGDGVYTFALIPTTGDGFAAHSREGSAPPRLILTTGTPPPPPPPSGVVLEADAQVLADQPGTNFGSTTSLAADQQPVTESYLRFRVTGSSNVTGAKLQFTVTNATADAPTVHSASSTWAESSITWSSRPALGPAIANLGAVSTGVIEYDVSALVTGDGVYTFALIPTTGDGFAAHSREGSAPPRLILTTGTPPPPPPAITAVLEADAYAAADAPGTSFGGAAFLSADQSPIEEAYLRFRVSGITTAPAQARLRLLVTDASSDGPALHLATNDWSEASLTWNNRPALTSGVIGDLGAASVGQVVEYDLSGVITADGVYTFALIATSGSGFGVSSREGGTPPALIVQ